MSPPTLTWAAFPAEAVPPLGPHPHLAALALDSDSITLSLCPTIPRSGDSFLPLLDSSWAPGKLFSSSKTFGTHSPHSVPSDKPPGMGCVMPADI